MPTQVGGQPEMDKDPYNLYMDPAQADNAIAEAEVRGEAPPEWAIGVQAGEQHTGWGPVTGMSRYPTHDSDNPEISLPLVNNMTPYEMTGFANAGKVDLPKDPALTNFHNREGIGWGFGHEPPGYRREGKTGFEGTKQEIEERDIFTDRLRQLAQTGEDILPEGDDIMSWVSTTRTDPETGEERREGPVMAYHPQIGLPISKNLGLSMIAEAQNNQDIKLHTQPVEMSPDLSANLLQAHLDGGMLHDGTEDEDAFNKLQPVNETALSKRWHRLLSEKEKQDALYMPNRLWHDHHAGGSDDDEMSRVEQLILGYHPEWSSGQSDKAFFSMGKMGPHDLAWEVIVAGQILKSIALLS